MTEQHELNIYTMKKKVFLAAAIVCAGMTTSFAQKGVEDGSRFGHGEDSIRCLRNISIYTEYVKTDNFKDAYEPWKAVFTEAPVAQVGTYTNGAKILRWLIENEKDATKKQTYFEELMKVHDQRIQYLDKLNKLVKRGTTKGAIVGLKAHDYYTMGGKDLNQAYALFKEAIELDTYNTEYYVLQEFMDIATQKFKKDDAYREQLIQDYLFASQYTDEAVEKAANEKDKKRYEVVKENLDAYLVNSGAADCAMLQTVYGPKVEQNKNDLDYLNNVIKVMRMLNCQDEEAYATAALYAHQLSPSAETAVGCAYNAFKKGNSDDVIKFMDEALSLEKDSVKAAEYAYNAAAMLTSAKSYSIAKKYAQKSIALNPDKGATYILLAQMYAASPNWSEEPALNKCTYFLAIDKLQRAKNIDPSCAEQAQELINAYSAHTPKAEDLFFLGIKKGDAVTIGGWIGETTTVR